jgi:2,4-didehydro-3-deoxy-L-rhamnonate hydrolase
MVDKAFKLATVSSGGSPPYVVIVLDDLTVAIEGVRAHASAARQRPALPISARSMLDLLECWDANLDHLCELVAFLDANGLEDPRWREAVAPLAQLKIHAPIPRPPKMLYAAVNYPRAGREPPKIDGARRPAMFQKTSSCVVGPYDDVVKPAGFDDLSWEVEFALVIGRLSHRVSPERALEHVAGYMTANDVTVLNFRRPDELAIPGPDWYGAKCHDTFAPLGPFLVPRVFVPDCRNLRLTCKVNGETLQDGNTRDMIISPEEQIAHCSNQGRLEPGDVISTGTPSGIAMHVGRYLKVGDIMECEVEGLGAQRSRLVAPD